MNQTHRSKRVLVVTEKFPFPLHDGGNLRTYYIIKGLAAAHSVILVSHYPEENENQAISELEVLCERVELVEESSIVRNVTAGVLETNGKLRSMFALKNWSKALLDRAKSFESQVDAIHLNHLDTAAFLLAWQPQVPVVFDSHNCLSQMAARAAEDAPSFLMRATYRWEAARLARLENTVTGLADVCLTCSPVDTELFEKLNSSGCFVEVPNGVDLAFFKQSDEFEEESDTLVFTGSMNYYPNVRAVQFMCEHVMPLLDPSVKFYIVGASPTQDVLNLHDGARVVVTGRVDDVRPYIERASLVVVPLLHGSGTRLKVLEAFAMAKAVISTSVGSEGIPISSGKELVIADTAVEFSSAIREYLRNSTARKKLGSRAYEFVANQFSWKGVSKALLSAYRDLNTNRGTR